jgi:hypothetical protein
MYKNKYDNELKDETNFVKKIVIWVVLGIVVLSIGGWILTRPAKIAEKVLDESLNNYEKFQEIYNTCAKINLDLGSLKNIPADDKMFTNFSKEAQLNQKRMQMNRWVEEYNAKSKMWNRAMWKSNKLPYQLSTEQFSNY